MSTNLQSANGHFAISSGSSGSCCEIPDPSSRHHDPFSQQERALGKQVATVAAELSARRNHPVTGDGGIARFPHDVADRAVGTGPPGGGGDVTVGGDAPMGNSTYDASGRGKQNRTYAPLGDWKIGRLEDYGFTDYGLFLRASPEPIDFARFSVRAF